MSNEKGVVYAEWDVSCDGYYPYCTNCYYEPAENEILGFKCPKCNAIMKGKREYEVTRENTSL